MFRIGAIVILAVCLASVLGCGGGSGSSGGGNSPFVNVEDTRFFAKNTTIQAGGSVQFRNLVATPQQVVSGTLDPQGSPLVIHTINITLTGFNPNSLTANLGDTIRFNNISGNTFVMDVVDDNGILVSTVVFNVGDLKTFVFPGAGLFIFRQQGSSIFQGSIILFGQPHPDGQFQSPVLTNGGIFKKAFSTVGTFPFFALDQNNPNQSFKTGTIIVQ